MATDSDVERPLVGRERYAAVTETLVRALWVLAPFLILLAVSLVVHWSYLVEPGRPFFADSNLPLTYDDFARTYFDVWNVNEGRHNFPQYMRLSYVAPFYFLFRALGIDANLFVRFLFWLPTYLGMASGYVFFRRTLGDRADGRRLIGVALLLGVLYGLNPWITKHLYQYYFRVSVAFLPVALLFSFAYLRRGRRRHLALAGVFATLLTVNPHFMIYFFILAGTWILFDGLLSGTLRRYLLRARQFGVVYLGLNAFWMLPFFYVKIHGGSARGYNVGPRIVRAYSTRNTPLNQLSFMGGYWQGITELGQWWFEPLLLYQVVFLAIPLVAFAALLDWDGDDRFGLYCLIAILVLLPLSTGYRYVGPLYDLSMALPFHELFRAPSRLTSFFPLLYGYLIGRTILDGRWRALRGTATALVVVACLALVVVNAGVFAGALGPTAVPDDHRAAEAAGYEDTFFSPPRTLGGYDPDWMVSREGGLVDSHDAHLYAYPDSRSHWFNYYVFELLDRGETDAAVDVLRKTGANHVLVRTRASDNDGIPPAEETVARLGAHPEVTREQTGENLVVFDLNASDRRFRVVRPVPVEEDVAAARRLPEDPAVQPQFDPSASTPPRSESGCAPGVRRGERTGLLDEVDGEQLFHPANMYERLNRMDVLSRSPAYDGVHLRGEQRVVPPESNGSLVLRATPLDSSSSVVTGTDGRRTIYNLADGHNWLCIDLDGRQRPVTIHGPMYVDRLFVAGEDPVRPSRQVETRFLTGGTVTPNRTQVSVDRTDSGLVVENDFDPGGAFWQLHYDPALEGGGPLTVTVNLTASAGDEIGVVVLTDSGEARLFGSGERFQDGRQTVRIRVPALRSGNATDVQFAVLPRAGRGDGEVTIHDLRVEQRVTTERPVAGRPDCEADRTAANCEGAATVTDVQRRSATRYEIRVDAEQPYTLQFAEPHDSLWVAEVPGSDGTERYGAEPLYSVTNGFGIDETGEHTVTVRYLPRQWFEYGLVISGLTGLLVGLFLLDDVFPHRGPIGRSWVWLRTAIARSHSIVLPSWLRLRSRVVASLREPVARAAEFHPHLEERTTETDGRGPADHGAETDHASSVDGEDRPDPEVVTDGAALPPDRDASPGAVERSTRGRSTAGTGSPARGIPDAELTASIVEGVLSDLATGDDGSTASPGDDRESGVTEMEAAAGAGSTAAEDVVDVSATGMFRAFHGDHRPDVASDLPEAGWEEPPDAADGVSATAMFEEFVDGTGNLSDAAARNGDVAPGTERVTDAGSTTHDGMALPLAGPAGDERWLSESDEIIGAWLGSRATGVPGVTWKAGRRTRPDLGNGWLVGALALIVLAGATAVLADPWYANRLLEVAYVVLVPVVAVRLVEHASGGWFALRGPSPGTGDVRRRLGRLYRKIRERE